MFSTFWFRSAGSILMFVLFWSGKLIRLAIGFCESFLSCSSLAAAPLAAAPFDRCGPWGEPPLLGPAAPFTAGPLPLLSAVLSSAAFAATASAVEAAGCLPGSTSPSRDDLPLALARALSLAIACALEDASDFGWLCSCVCDDCPAKPGA